MCRWWLCIPTTRALALVGSDLRVAIIERIGGVKPGIGFLQALQVAVGRPLRGEFGCRRLEQVAELDHVILQEGVLIDQLLPGIGEAGFQAVGDVGAAAMAADQQVTGNELLDRLAQ